MAQDLITLFRLALSGIGMTRLPDSPNENHPGANECRLWFEPVRDYILRSAHWPSAKAVRRLGELAERADNADWVATDPLPGWRFMYQAPADLLAPRYISTWDRFETGVQDGKRVIYTDSEDAILIYTSQQDNLTLWDPSLFMATASALGAYICNGLTGKPQKAQAAMQQANAIILQARADAANEMQQVYDSVPEWIAARGYTGAILADRFIYPYGPMLIAPGAALV